MTRLGAVIVGFLFAGPAPGAQECVVLLHGLARTSQSMAPMAAFLERQNFRVSNIDYPSREKPIDELAPLAVEAGIQECTDESSKIHFVTHSLGGILVRVYLSRKTLDRLGRVVMLAPPNQGSEVVDNLRNMPGFDLWNGPAGSQLGTDPESVPSTLGPVDFPVGVIAGTTTINLLLSQFLPNPDDGKVSVERTRVNGMQDFATVAVSHPFIMRNDEAKALTLRFLKTGRFNVESR